MLTNYIKRIFIVIMALVLIVSVSVSEEDYSKSVTTTYTATTTDTTTSFAIGNYQYAYLSVWCDVHGSATFTQTVTILDKNLRPISQASTVSSAITADAHKQLLLRNRDTTRAIQPRFFIKRVSTLTGDTDSTTCYMTITAW